MTLSDLLETRISCSMKYKGPEVLRTGGHVGVMVADGFQLSCLLPVLCGPQHRSASGAHPGQGCWVARACPGAAQPAGLLLWARGCLRSHDRPHRAFPVGSAARPSLLVVSKAPGVSTTWVLWGLMLQDWALAVGAPPGTGHRAPGH